MSDVTLWRSLQKPEFAEAYRKARRDAFSQSVARLQHASNAAVGTLLRVMTDREAPRPAVWALLMSFCRPPCAAWKWRILKREWRNWNGLRHHRNRGSEARP